MVAEAMTKLVPGDYVSANRFKISIEKYGEQDVYVRADGVIGGRAQYVAFRINRATGRPYVYGYGRQDFALVGSKDEDGVRSFTFASGGAFSGSDRKIKVGIRLATGELTSLSAITKVARWSLPGGWHSGPIKDVADDFDAASIVRTSPK